MSYSCFRYRAIVTLAVIGVGLATISTAGANSLNHGNPSVYLDLVPGDAGAAPDILTTTVSNTLAGEIDFNVVFANRTAFGPDDIISIVINADKDTATGDEDGSDYIVQVRGADVALARLFADGHFEVISAPSLRNSWDKSVERIAFSSSDLGNTTSFQFYEHSFIAGDPSVFDDSPDGTNVWEYTLLTPHIADIRTTFTPGVPRAGSLLHVTATSAELASGEALAVDSATCRATIGGVVLRGTGTGACTFALPRGSKGKAMRVTVTAHVRDQSKTFAYLKRIR